MYEKFVLTFKKTFVCVRALGTSLEIVWKPLGIKDEGFLLLIKGVVESNLSKKGNSVVLEKNLFRSGK